jgi:hypothetical protein
VTTIRVTRRPRTPAPEGEVAATRPSDAPPDGVEGPALTDSPGQRPRATAARPDGADTAVWDSEGGRVQR